MTGENTHDWQDVADAIIAADDDYPPRHPDADKLKLPTWDEPGECICGKPLPPEKDWDRAGMDWANVLCSSCGRGYVDEEDYFDIYDPIQIEDRSDWKVHSCPGCGHTQHQGFCDCGCLDDRVDIARQGDG